MKYSKMEVEMILYNGKAKNYTYQLLMIAALMATKPIEKLEPEDFSKN